jgi:hypothetical protein
MSAAENNDPESPEEQFAQELDQPDEVEWLQTQALAEQLVEAFIRQSGHAHAVHDLPDTTAAGVLSLAIMRLAAGVAANDSALAHKLLREIEAADEEAA